MADHRAPMQKFGKYGYECMPHEIVRDASSNGGRGIATSLAPSAMREAPKPWLADALPRRFQDGLGLPDTWVEGVLAAPDEPAHAPFTAPRKHQRTYETPQAGGCLCGAVRFAVNAGREPRLVVACFCRFCQKSSGATHLGWATIDADDYTLLQARCCCGHATHCTPRARVRSLRVARACAGRTARRTRARRATPRS
jgi:hypothetical protein